VSNGDALAAARRQAGLTIAQVSERTRIRETIIRGIECGDYSACGGDFYARGHIRSIARAMGADPEPFLRDYDACHGPPLAITAADIFEPSTPIKFKERRRLNWTAVMALALALILGFVVYRVAARPQHAPAAAARATAVQARARAAARRRQLQAREQAAHAAQAHARQVVIHLSAAADCWVQLTTAAGRTIFTGFVYAGTARSWTERQAVSLRIGDPAAITLTVNGKSRSPGPPGQPVTLSFGPAQQTSG
jgi:cytoskeletal protein RodZ